MDLIEALQAAEIEFRDGSNEDEIWLCCPEPGCSDERFRLGVNIVTGAAHCFNCEWKAYGQYAFNRLQEALDTGEIEAKQAKRRKKKKRMEKLELPEGFQLLVPPSEDDDHWNKKAWSYVRGRGITREQIRDKKIGFTVIGDLAYRVIAPVYMSGVLVGLVGRDFTDKQELKYRNSVGSKYIYNIPEKKHSTICLSEGFFDALVIEHGAKKLSMDSGSLLGHSLQDGQLDYLLKHYKRFVLWPDPDVAGIDGAISIRKKIPRDKSLRVVLPKGMLDGKDFDKRDPSDMDVEEIVKRLDKAEVFTEEMTMKMENWKVYDE